MIKYLFSAKNLAENYQLCLELQMAWVLKTKIILLKTFVESHFGYCPLICKFMVESPILKYSWKIFKNSVQKQYFLFWSITKER